VSGAKDIGEEGHVVWATLFEEDTSFLLHFGNGTSVFIPTDELHCLAAELHTIIEALIEIPCDLVQGDDDHEEGHPPEWLGEHKELWN
jgi:hypothetical protein